MSIYQEIILDHYHAPQNFGRLKESSQTVSLSNPLCGDTITVDVLIKNDKIIDIRFEGVGCAISIASASLLTEKVKKKQKEEVILMNKDTVLELLGIELSPNRLKCALLPLEAIHKTLQLK